MAHEEKVQCVSRNAAGDLSAKQYRFMTTDSDGQIDAAGAGAKADGVLYNKPSAAGRAGQLAVGGVVKVQAGAAVLKGADVASTSVGKGVTATTGDVILGVCVHPAGADGDIMSVQLMIENRAVVA